MQLIASRAMMKFFILLLLLAASISFAIEPSASQDNCGSAATQSELDQCASANLQKADAALSDFVASYQQRLSPEQLTLFQQAQAAWEQFRRASCQFAVSGVMGGSIYPMAFNYCMASKAQERLEELEKLANCEEGDAVCPVPR